MTWQTSVTQQRIRQKSTAVFKDGSKGGGVVSAGIAIAAAQDIVLQYGKTKLVYWCKMKRLNQRMSGLQDKVSQIDTIVNSANKVVLNSSFWAKRHKFVLYNG